MRHPLRYLYELYVSTVSTPQSSLSWESTAWLAAQEGTFPGPTPDILDLGSGWSTVALRWLYPHSMLCAIDTDSAWLDRTLEFMRANGLVLPGMTGVYPHIPTQILAPRYDIVLYDMGTRKFREENLDVALGIKCGLLLFDDYNWPRIEGVKGSVPCGGTRDKWGRCMGALYDSAR